MSAIQHVTARLAAFLRGADRLAEHLQGQDHERPATISGRRSGSRVASITQAHVGRGSSPFGIGF